MVESNTESVGENNNFGLIFGDNARSKVMYVLFFFENKAHTKSKLADYANVSRPTVYEHVEKLEKMGIAIEEDDGRVRVNKESELAKSIARVEWKFIQKWAEIEKEEGSDGLDKFLTEIGCERIQEDM